MEKILIEFINTLDDSFKKLLSEAGSTAGSQLTISQFQYIDAIYELEKPTITEVAHKLAIALGKKIQLENGTEVATKLITDYLKQQ